MGRCSPPSTASLGAGLYYESRPCELLVLLLTDRVASGTDSYVDAAIQIIRRLTEFVSSGYG